MADLRNKIDSLERQVKALTCALSALDEIDLKLDKPVDEAPGKIAIVDATGNDVEWVDIDIHSHNQDLITLNAGQTTFNISDIAIKPETSVLIYDNHPLMYGIGYTISGSVVTLTLGNNWEIEDGEKVDIKYLTDA